MFRTTSCAGATLPSLRAFLGICTRSPGRRGRAARAGRLGDLETEIIEGYLANLSESFTALSMKYLLSGMVDHRLPARLEIDQTDSGFPMFREMIKLSDDREKVKEELDKLPPAAQLKNDIIDHLLKFKTLPRELQFTLSQRVYFETLAEKQLFISQNRPVFILLSGEDDKVMRYMVHWAVYDRDRNFPNLYMMVLEDSSHTTLARNPHLRGRVESHLMAQSSASLKLLTIATGFDKDFDTLHPKLIKRVHVGPLYSNKFTRHSDPVQKVLTEAGDDLEQDWVFCWTVESLFSKDVKRTPSGFFGETLHQIYHVDIHSPEVFDAGASAIDRAMIMPYRPYQRLVESDYDHLKAIRKYVVGPDGLVLNHA